MDVNKYVILNKWPNYIQVKNLLAEAEETEEKALSDAVEQIKEDQATNEDKNKGQPHGYVSEMEEHITMEPVGKDELQGVFDDEPKVKVSVRNGESYSIVADVALIDKDTDISCSWVADDAEMEKTWAIVMIMQSCISLYMATAADCESCSTSNIIMIIRNVLSRLLT